MSNKTEGLLHRRIGLGILIPLTLIVVEPLSALNELHNPDGSWETGPAAIKIVLEASLMCTLAVAMLLGQLKGERWSTVRRDQTLWKFVVAGGLILALLVAADISWYIQYGHVRVWRTFLFVTWIFVIWGWAAWRGCCSGRGRSDSESQGGDRK